MSTPIVIAGFPVDDSIALKKRDSYLDIQFEISNHGRESGRKPGGTWCYYVTVSEDMLSPEAFTEFWLEPSSFNRRSSGRSDPTYSYYEARFAGAAWHCGVSWYEKLGGIDGQQRAVKIGCDFAHLWDEDREFDFSQVRHECIQTIDELRCMYAFKRRCAYTGQWLPEDELILDGERLYSPDGMAKRAAYRAEREGGAA